MTHLADRPSTVTATVSGPLDRALGAVGLTWEVAAYLALLAIGGVMRLWDLGVRAMHHDESLHVLYGWYLYVGRGYQNDPMMHGPFHYHAIALSYFLFGDNDFTGRLPFALLGILFIGLPFFLRSYIGRWGALIAATLFAFSPILLYYNRFAREDTPLITWTLLLAIAAWRYLAKPDPKWLYLGAAAMALGFSTKAAHFITVAIFGSFLTGYWLWQMAPNGRMKSIGRLLADARGMPIFGFLIMMGTITLPQLAAFLKLTPVISTSQAVMVIGPWVTTQAIFSQFMAVAALLLVAAAVGIWWNRTLFLTYTAVFFTIYGLLYTTFFTNLPGFGSGMWNMLSYWLDQHEVQRGGQPWYYYLLLIPQYEYLALLVAGVGLGLLLFNQRFRGWLTPFTLFLLYWFAGALFAYSKAGEKMPWLSVQIIPPLLLFAAWFLGKLAERVDWGSIRAWRSVGAAALFVVAALTFAAAIADAITRTPQGDFVVGRALALIVIAVVLAAGGVLLANVFGARGVTATASLGMLTLLFLLQLRTGWIVTYAHGDIAEEMLIYTQSSPDITRINREIERLSLQTTGGLDLKISVDSTSGFTWPWAWYLRDYRNVDYPNFTAQAGPPTGDVVFVHANNVERMRPFLQDFTPGQRYRHRWWFPEDYKTPIEWIAAMGSPIAAQPRPNDSFGFGDVLAATFSPTGLNTIWTYFFNRELPRPLGSEDGFVFVRRSVAANAIGGGAIANLGPAASLPDRPGDSGAPSIPNVPGAGQDPQLRPSVVQPSLVVGARGAAPGQLSEPKGIAMDADGNLYVLDAGNHRLQKFSPTGQLLAQVGRRGSGNGEFQEPWGVAIGPDGSVWVADTWNHRIQRFTANLEFVSRFGEYAEARTALENPGRFFGPRSIVVLADGTLLVSDTGNMRLQRFQPDGQFVGAVGGRGPGLGQFSEPVGLALTPDGVIVVADTWNRRIVTLDQSLRATGAFPVRGWESTGILNKPYLAIDATGTILATDPENNRVLRFSPDGALLGVIGQGGAQPGQFNQPIGVAIDRNGALVVSEHGNHRVQRFDTVP